MINKVRLVKLAQELIRINSENPPGDERQIADFTLGYLKRMGLAPRTYAFKEKRANVVASLERPGNRHSLLVTPHLDTVPAGKNWRIDPFKARIIRGKLYGLGATDCKGNLAACLEALNSITEEKRVLDYNLIFAATADEESGSGLGLIPLLDKKILQPDAALVLDADDFEVIVTQKGLIHLTVKIEGRRAHGAYPYRGVNAIDLALGVLREIKNYKLPHPANKYLKAPTVNIGTIRGGDKVNVVADWCEFELDFRFLPGTRAEEIMGALKTILKKHAKRFKIEVQGIQQPYTIPEDHALVKNLKKAMQACRTSPRLKGSEGATVITFFQHKHIPAAAWGFGAGGCAHAAGEYIKIDNLYKGAQVLEEFLLHYK